MAENTAVTAPLRITVRILTALPINDGTVYQSNQVVELDADIANDLIANGLADGDADAVAYALSL